MPKKLKLYEFGPTRALRVRWALQELGLEFEPVTVDLKAGEQWRPSFHKLNPAGKLPVLLDGDMVMTESVAIVLYLAEEYGNQTLLPEELEDRAQVTRWSLFAATELEQPLWRIARHTWVYPEKRRVPADIPVARQDFLDMASVLDAHMQSRNFLVGQHFTAADIVTAYTLDWANEEELLVRFPRLSEYMERMYERPAAPVRIAKATPVNKN